MPNVPPKRKPFVWKLPVETPALVQVPPPKP